MIKLPSGLEINSLIDDLRLFSWEASDILLYYSNMLKNAKLENNFIQNRNINDPVTLADLKVNEIIIKRINENYKDIDWDILSEENFKKGPKYCNLNSDWIWILDPLDGTKDFIQGTSNYAMHLSLNYKKKPYIGVVLIPEKDELWISYGENIISEKRSGEIIKKNTSQKDFLEEMTLVTSKNHKNKVLQNLIEKIQFQNVIEMGSIGCKIASIIRGESDLYISLSLPGKSSPKDWDFAAPEAILRANGGAITNLDNENLIYNKPNFEQSGIIIASNNKNKHENICLELKNFINKYNLFCLET